MHAFFPSCMLINQVHKVFLYNNLPEYTNIIWLYQIFKLLFLSRFNLPKSDSFFFRKKTDVLKMVSLSMIWYTLLRGDYKHFLRIKINMELMYVCHLYPNLPWLNPFSAEYWTIWRIACGYPVVIYCCGFPLGIKHISANNSHMYIRKTAIYIIQVYFNMISN